MILLRSNILIVLNFLQISLVLTDFLQTSFMNPGLLPGWPLGFGFVLLFVLLRFCFLGKICAADRLTCLLRLTVTRGGSLR